MGHGQEKVARQTLLMHSAHRRIISLYYVRYHPFPDFIINYALLLHSYGIIACRPKPACIENIELMWYVDKKGGTNAVKYEKN